MRLLVTGASGFLGWHLCRQLADRWEIHAVANTHPVAIPGVPVHQVDLARGDQVEELFRFVRPDAVVHAAALSRGDVCQREPERSWQANVVASQNIARLCATREIACVYTSTDLVFDGEDPPYREESVPKPLSTYGEHKAEAERQMRGLWPGMTICRLPLMYGPPGPVSSGFLAPMIESLGERRPLRLFTDEFRTPITVDDAVRGIELCLQQPGELLHCGGPERISRYEFGLVLCELLGADPQLLVPSLRGDTDFPAPRPADVSLDSRRAKELGFEALSIREGLVEVLKQFRED